MGLLKDIMSFFKGKPKEKIKVLLTCPNCHGEELKERENMGVILNLCNSCHGCFITQDGLNTFLNFHREEDWPDLFELKADSEHTYERSKTFRKCPACKESMENIQFQYTSGIWVDYCPKGEGIWLDSGELSLIKEHKSNMMGVAAREKPAAAPPESLHEKPVREETPVTEIKSDEEKTYEPPKTQPVLAEEKTDVEEKIKEQQKKSDYLKILAKLPGGRFQEYREKAQKEWEKDRVNFGDAVEMVDSYFKDKVKQYAEEDGIM